MKNFINKSTYVLFLFTLVFLSSCSKDDDGGGGKPGFDGSKQSIKEFVGAEIYSQLIEFGFNINEGSEPPSISGKFYADDLEILDSSVPGDISGSYMVSQTFEFKNQNDDELTVEYSGGGGSQTDEGAGSFIAGSGSSFLVLLKNESTIQGYTSETLFAISGKMTAEGILNYQLAGFNVNISDDTPEGIFIPEGTGRVIHDTGDLAERI